MPCLSAAAFVMRGATAGAAVEATAMDVERLCPGTSMKACFSCSLVGGTLEPFGESPRMTPARRAAALVVRGAMSGTRVVAGIGLARKLDFPSALILELRPPTVEGFVADDAAYPSDVDRCKLESIDEAREPGGNWVVADGELSSLGRSWVGYTGDDAKRDAICTSAVCVSGDPMRPFCSRERPYRARSELGEFSRATAGSLSPMSVFQTSTARRRSKTYTQTGPSARESASSPKSSYKVSGSVSVSNSICLSLIISKLASKMRGSMSKR